MSFIFEPLRKYADFQGRARRAEYWQFMLLVGVIELAIWIVAKASGEGGAPAGNPLVLGVVLLVLAVMILGLFIPSLAVSVRRLHDTNRSGWWFLISFIPLLGGLIFFVFSVLDGNKGDNRFGPDPKGREREALVAA